MRCSGVEVKVLVIGNTLVKYKYTVALEIIGTLTFFSKNVQFLPETLQMETCYCINRCTYLVCRGPQQKTGINNTS